MKEYIFKQYLDNVLEQYLRFPTTEDFFEETKNPQER